MKDVINGFVILKDNGRKGRKRMGIAICKVCQKEFEVCLYNLRYNKCCGCIVNKQPVLPDEINGFKIIKDLGRIPNRSAIVACKLCGRHHRAVIYQLHLKQSCGCLKEKPFKCDYRKSHKRLVQIYKCMRMRCYNKKHNSYKNYGAIGIMICDEWFNDANLFCEWALQNGYDDNLTIDRIDGKQGYKASNCRWVDITEQNRNARTNVLTLELARQIRKEDPNMTRQQVADKYGVSRGTITAVLLNKTWVEK